MYYMYIYLRTQLQHLFCRVDPSLHSLFFLQVLRLHCILPFWKNPDVITLYSFRVKKDWKLTSVFIKESLYYNFIPKYNHILTLHLQIIHLRIPWELNTGWNRDLFLYTRFPTLHSENTKNGHTELTCLLIIKIIICKIH